MKKALLTIPLALTIAVAFLFATIPQNAYIAYCAGTPDAYGNQILNFKVYQNDTGAWVWKGTITSANYTAGFQIRVEEGPCVMFNVTVRLNKTMASNIAEAVTNTRVYMNISDAGAVWTNELMDDWNDGGVDVGPGTYYSVTYSEIWSDATKPLAGITYDISIKYEAYY